MNPSPSYLLKNAQGRPIKLLSKSGRLAIELLDIVEPNNGRMLWTVNVLMDGQSLNAQLFSEGWNHINFNINKLMLEDAQADYFYIPTEGKSCIVNGASGKIRRTKSQAGSTVSFVGNSFSHKHLLEIFIDQLVLTELSSFKTKKYFPDFKGRILAATLLDANTAHITYAFKEGDTWQEAEREVVFEEL